MAIRQLIPIRIRTASSKLLPRAARFSIPAYPTTGLNFISGKPLNSVEETATFYDGVAQNYEQLVCEQGWSCPELCVAALFKAIKKQSFPPQAALRIFDLGAGSGLVGAELREKLTDKYQLQMTAFDVSEKMLEKAKEKKIYDHFQTGDIMDPKLRVATAPFEVVTCVGVTSYLSPDPALFKMVEVLVPGGLLVITYKTPTVAPNWIALHKQLVSEGKIEIVEHSTGNKYLPGNPAINEVCDIVVLQKL